MRATLLLGVTILLFLLLAIAAYSYMGSGSRKPKAEPKPKPKAGPKTAPVTHDGQAPQRTQDNDEHEQEQEGNEEPDENAAINDLALRVNRAVHAIRGVVDGEAVDTEKLLRILEGEKYQPRRSSAVVNHSTTHVKSDARKSKDDQSELANAAIPDALAHDKIAGQETAAHSAALSATPSVAPSPDPPAKAAAAEVEGVHMSNVQFYGNPASGVLL